MHGRSVKLRQTLEKMTGKKIVVELQHDPDLIGGRGGSNRRFGSRWKCADTAVQYPRNFEEG